MDNESFQGLMSGNAIFCLIENRKGKKINGKRKFCKWITGSKTQSYATLNRLFFQ